MKKSRIILGILVVLIVVYLLGPRIKADIKIKPVSVPQNVEQYIQKSEARFPDIREDAEKIIRWYNPKKKNKTAYSILYVHGYTACRREISPVVERVADTLGANVYFTRLKGHLRKADALSEATVGDWFHDILESVEIARRIGDRIIIVGTSTGATLTTWLLAKNEMKDVAAAVMISPNFWPRSPLAHLMVGPWGEQITRFILGKYRTWEPRNEEEKKCWNYKQTVDVLLTMLKLVDYVNDMELKAFKQPVLVVYSPNDQVVDSGAIEDKFKEFGSREKKIVPFTVSSDEYQHVLAGDILSPTSTNAMVSEILTFLNKNLKIKKK